MGDSYIVQAERGRADRGPNALVTPERRAARRGVSAESFITELHLPAVMTGQFGLLIDSEAAGPGGPGRLVRGGRPGSMSWNR